MHINALTKQLEGICQSTASEPSHSTALAKVWFPEWYSGEVGEALSGSGRLRFLKSDSLESDKNW